MRRYFMRQVSMRWFENYLYLSGVALNVIALFSFISLVSHGGTRIDHTQRARIELENARLCTKHMAGRNFSSRGDSAFSIRLLSGKEMPLSYKAQSTFGHTKDGHALEMARVQYSPSESGYIFFSVNSEKQIERCISAYGPGTQRSQEIDCLSSSGEYSAEGICTLPVNLPSDCAIMGGMILNGSCAVPKGRKILRASVDTSAQRVCKGPDCKK